MQVRLAESRQRPGLFRRGGGVGKVGHQHRDMPAITAFPDQFDPVGGDEVPIELAIDQEHHGLIDRGSQPLVEHGLPGDVLDHGVWNHPLDRGPQHPPVGTAVTDRQEEW